MQEMYTTNPIERSTAATEHSTSKSDLVSPVESHRELADQVDRLASTDDSKSLSLVERLVTSAEHLVLKVNNSHYTLLQKKRKFNLSILPGAPKSLTLT